MSTQDPTRLTDVDPLVMTERATAGQRIGALAIDVGAPLVGAAAATVAFSLDADGLGWMLLAAVVAMVGVTLHRLATDGRSLGALAAGTRTVERTSAAAAGASLPRALFSGALGTYDLRRGRDPFAPALAPFRFPERAAVPAPAVRRAPSATPVVVLDSGERLPLISALVLGRAPTAPPDAPAELYQWPDLSRTLSKSHARLEWDGSRAWVTDLGSTNGTFVGAGERAQPLLPHQRTPLPPDVSLGLGDRILTLSAAR